MSLNSTTIKQCCATAPVWIFVYSDGRIFAICENDFRSPSYRIGVEKIINMNTKASFPPEQIFVEKLK